MAVVWWELRGGLGQKEVKPQARADRQDLNKLGKEVPMLYSEGHGKPVEGVNMDQNQLAFRKNTGSSTEKGWEEQSLKSRRTIRIFWWQF